MSQNSYDMEFENIVHSELRDVWINSMEILEEPTPPPQPMPFVRIDLGNTFIIGVLMDDIDMGDINGKWIF